MGGWALQVGEVICGNAWHRLAADGCAHIQTLPALQLHVCVLPGNCVATEECLTSSLQCWLCWRWVQAAAASLLCLFLLAWLPCRPEPWRSAPQPGAQQQQAAPAAQESREQGSTPVRKTAPKIAPVSGHAVLPHSSTSSRRLLLPSRAGACGSWPPACGDCFPQQCERKKERKISVLDTCLSVCRQTRRLNWFVPSQCNCSPASSNVPCTRRRQPSLQPRQLHSWQRQRRRQYRSLG